ncbi:hypothetical protein [Streptomyces zaomyceticus]|uniref:hypothetical protein n=1 Tax=Streptomyces zaomyceticus TaxID=68286 RepID=UPI002E205372
MTLPIISRIPTSGDNVYVAARFAGWNANAGFDEMHAVDRSEPEGLYRPLPHPIFHIKYRE